MKKSRFSDEQIVAVLHEWDAGAKVAEPALMLIDPYPWSAPVEDVRLKK